MPESQYHSTSAEIAARRKELAAHVHEAFEVLKKAVFADGALPEQTKQLIAVAVAHTPPNADPSALDGIAVIE